jgi:hypothetical protein
LIHHHFSMNAFELHIPLLPFPIDHIQ